MLSIKKITIHKIKHYWKNLGKKINQAKTSPKIKRKNINKTNRRKTTQKKKGNQYEENKGEIPKIAINNENINYMNTNLKNTNSNIISFSNKMSFTNLNTNITTSGPFKKSLNTEIINNKYISFGRTSSKMISTNYLLADKSSSKSGSQNKFKSQRNVSSFLKKKTIPNLRIEYIQKLNNKIKTLKKSKKYYKDYCRSLLIKQQNIENMIRKNGNITFESVDKKYSSFELFNSGVQSAITNNQKENKITDISFSDSNQSESSKSSLSKENILAISTSITLTFASKYKNLDKLTVGEYSKNRNLRISTEKFIKLYLSKIKEQKEEKMLDKYLTKKSFNTIFGDYSTNQFYTNEIKLKKLMTSDSYLSLSRKKITNKSNDLRYLNNYEDKKYFIYYTAKKKVPNLNNYKYYNTVKRNTLKKYLLNKSSSYDSVRKKSSIVFRNISKSNLSSCSSYKHVKDEIHKINTKNEYEQEIQLKNSEHKTPKKNSNKK
jgi:hypothetical protein